MFLSFKNIIRSNTFKTFRDFSTSSAEIAKSILVDHHFDIKLISINRPSKRNSLDIETIYQLKEALQNFDNDSTATVAVLHGEGGTFCSGFDIDEVMEKGYNSIIEACIGLAEGPLCKKPLIAAIDGFAVAEGFELALACDMRVIEETATLGFMGKRYGAPALLGGPQRLTGLIGASKAIHLLCSAFQLNGVGAHEEGLAARLVSTGTCIGQAINLATAIAKYPQNGVIHDKMLVYKHISHENQQWIDRRKEEMKIFRQKSIQDIETNAVRFKEGIGKHGKFTNIKMRELLDWEKEEEQHDKA